MKHNLLLVIATLSLAVVAEGAAPPADIYEYSKQIAVPGTGWDYLSVDAKARRLYLSHSTKVVVINLDQATIEGEINDTPGVHGFAIAPELGRGFSSNGREAKASIVDLKTLKTLSKVDTGANPDAILYEPARREVYTFNGKGKSATVFEAESGKVVATIPLSGKPEFAVCDSAAGLVYVNIEDKSEVAVIDAKKHEVLKTWPLAPGEEPTGMAIDLAHHRLFVGCHNKQMIVMDSADGKIVATVPIGAGVDATWFDPETQLVFNSNGSGNVTIIREETPDKYAVAQTLPTAVGGRTMALDPKTHAIYVPAVQSEPAAANDAGAPGKRSGNINILVYMPIYTFEKKGGQ